MSLLPDVESILSNAGYRIMRNAAVSSSIAFEDDSVFGLVVEYETVRSLHEGWPCFPGSLTMNCKSSCLQHKGL